MSGVTPCLASVFTFNRAQCFRFLSWVSCDRFFAKRVLECAANNSEWMRLFLPLLGGHDAPSISCARKAK
jgi:hypothetical protein